MDITPTAAALRAAARLVGEGNHTKLVATAQIIDDEFRPALVALKKYRHCRHGSANCFCTEEAKAVLFGMPD